MELYPPGQTYAMPAIAVALFTIMASNNKALVRHLEEEIFLVLILAWAPLVAVTNRELSPFHQVSTAVFFTSILHVVSIPLVLWFTFKTVSAVVDRSNN